MSIKRLAKEVNDEVVEEADEEEDEDELSEDFEDYEEPSEILEYLYLGGNVAARDFDALARLKITNVVNVASHPMYPVVYDESFKVINIGAM